MPDFLPERGFMSTEQRVFYREHGWLLLEGAVSEDWLTRLRTACGAIVNRTRVLDVSTPAIELWREHSAADPRPYQVSSPEDMEPDFWDFARSDDMAPMASALLGGAVRYRYGAIRFRELGPSDLWHQDMPFDELRGEGVLAGIHLDDTRMEHPHLQVISGSHRGESFTHRDEKGEFIGELNAEEMRRVQGLPAVDLVAGAGSIEFLDYRTLHQDMWGGKERGGALLYAAYATEDSVSIGEPRYPDVVSGRRGTLLPAGGSSQLDQSAVSARGR